MERTGLRDIPEQVVVRQKTAHPRGRGRLLMAGLLALGFGLTHISSNTAQADGGELTADQKRVVRTYFQCGGDGYQDDHVVFVQQVRDPEGYNTALIGRVAGACGVRYIQPDSENRSLASVEYERAHGWPISVGTEDGRIFRYDRTYPQCGGSIGPMDINDRYTVIVDEFREPNTGETTHSWRTVGPQSGQCGNP